LHTPNNNACSNGLFCDGAETCSATQGCIAGTPPTLTDNIPCTTDACDEANDRITNTPNNAVCSNGLFCDGSETCSATQGCIAGTPPNLEDGLPCTDGACNEATDAVVQTPIHARCADANVCDGAEQCVVGVGCQEGAPLSQGAVCVTDPRSLCLGNACSLSRCGDMYVDAARGEQCDDGNMNDADACRNDCTNNTSSYNYNGTFGILPDLSYTCNDGLFGGVAVDYDISTFVFAVSGGSLTAQLSLGGKPFTTLAQRTSQAQTPAPTNGSFSLRWFFSGGGFGCDETYTLAGAFTDANTWQATFTRSYVDRSGLGLCGTCADGSTPVRGTRQ
jgi:cysteine-rich repeat protein